MIQSAMAGQDKWRKPVQISFADDWTGTESGLQASCNQKRDANGIPFL